MNEERKIFPEDVIDFLEQDDFRARKIIVVGKEYIFPKGGQKHIRARCFAKEAYCYEEITVVPVS